MPFIKKLVMHGFKSFPIETQVNFENSLNAFVGPNGSGKSNVADAICFVLGRLSMKSIRVAKTSSLIFAGTSMHKPSHEASVKLIFDNSDNGFSIESKEVEIERIVRRNGQGIYRINRELKTRNEVLELLAQAGIDPYGFNIIQQGEIQSFVKMHPEERRKIIEEVAGISVYEAKKEKSLHELDRTAEKLKEVSIILRDRTAFLKNLEQERAQAMKFKQLQETEKRCKASILAKQIDEKSSQLKRISDDIALREKQKEKFTASIIRVQAEISGTESRINEINTRIQKSTGIEQETLFSELTELREKLAVIEVHKENSAKKLEEVKARKVRAEESVAEFEKQISELQKKSPLQARKQQELETKRKAMEELEKQKRKFFSIKSERNSYLR